MSMHTAVSFEALVMVLLTAIGVTEAAHPRASAATFTNPIAEQGQDPWVTIHERSFYYCYAQDNSIRIKSATRLHRIDEGEPAIVWTAPKSGPFSKNIWAPELHRIDGRWYLYFAADDGDNRNHRMFVLRSEADNPLGPYTFMGKIADASNRWAIDGTVFLAPNGYRYFIWSGWPGETNGQQNLYIAPMSDPLTISGERILISEPTLPWETTSDPKVNEGPQILRRGENVHIIFSAGGSWTDDYCLGRLTLTGDDPLAPGAWTKHPKPVFAKTGLVLGPGHASFIHLKNADGPADWIVYHAARKKGSGWVRDIRLQPFTWDAQDSPDFGEPIPPGVPITTPKTLEPDRRIER
jgi:GH43 family beta-xylosidase